jgi:cysteinyl-tRNA synthetase
MNLTDVGHLTSDADEGEDKMIKGARREGKTVWEIADFYTKAFMNDIKVLNIIKPDIMPKATEHIKEMIEIIKKLEKKGYTYISGGNVYYDISKFKDYGKLARLKLNDLKAGARIGVDKEKRNPYDFVLWFTKSKFTNHEMKWNSPWGDGYPGWHIECSAMASKYLGEHFDIHCGGVDHIPVHHTNEIAQSEGAFGSKPWVNYWIHGEFLVIEKTKMAKSGENFIILKTLVERGFSPLDYRYFCFTAHYRKPLNFNWKSLEAAKNSFDNLKNRIMLLKDNLKDSKGSIEKYKEKFIELVNDDLNIPKAVALMQKVLRDSGLGNKQKYELVLYFDRVFGLGLDKVERKGLDKEIKKLIEEREKARKKKDFKKADKIRADLREKGIILEDTKKGVRWKLL